MFKKLLATFVVALLVMGACSKRVVEPLAEETVADKTDNLISTCVVGAFVWVGVVIAWYDRLFNAGGANLRFAVCFSCITAYSLLISLRDILIKEEEGRT
jgi:hypothetical protein